MLGRLHSRYVHGRRIRVLCEHLAALLPHGATVLDVGAGDGRLGALIAEARPDLTVTGLDTLVRADTLMPVTQCDGVRLPCEAQSVDAVLFVDVLHHTIDPMVLLREAVRVARQAIVIKDHRLTGFMARSTLTAMDWVGNARYGVALPNTYWSEAQWTTAFDALGVTVSAWQGDLRLYPWPADLVFGRSLHFVARLDVQTGQP